MSNASAETAPVNGYWDVYLPTEPPHYRITDIDILQWVEEGVNTLLLDAEATLCETGVAEIVPEHVAWIQEAREAGIENVALLSNFRVNDEIDRALLAGWGDQVGADRIFFPSDSKRRKPSPYMVFQAENYFQVDPNQMGIVDDKASAGIRSGRFSGVKHLGWTRPFGENRHIGDKLIRDPFESIMRIRAHMLLTPSVRDQLGPVLGEALGVDSLATVTELFHEESMPDGKDKIVGLGVEDIPLSPEQLAQLKEPVYTRTLNLVKGAIDYYSEQPAEKLKAYLHEHGRTTADWLTYSRLAIAAGLIALNKSELDTETIRKISAGLKVLNILTDVTDGPAARAHKDGATEKGGFIDQNIDHIESAITDIFTLVPLESISILEALIPVARDVGMLALRRPFSHRGIDTKSIVSGKVATGLLGGSQLFDLATGSRFPNTSKGLRHAALIAKIGSLAQAPFSWIENHEFELHEKIQSERTSRLKNIRSIMV